MAPRVRPLGVLIGALVVAAACGFPSVSYTSGDGGGVDGSMSDHVVTTDAPQIDVTRADDSGEMDSGGQDVISDYVFEATPDAPVCDQDLDGWHGKPPQDDMSCMPGQQYDCDDRDKRANPGITQYDCGQAHPPANGDWNCDGTVQVASGQAGPQIPTGVTCDTVMDLLTCNNTAGFEGLPNCGGTGTYIQCTFAVTCNIKTQMQLPECCK